MTWEGARGPPIKRDVFLAPSWTDLETQESTESRTPEASFMFPPFLYCVPMLKLSFEKIKSPDELRNVYSPLSKLKRIFLFLPREPTFGFHDRHWKYSSSHFSRAFQRAIKRPHRTKSPKKTFFSYQTDDSTLLRALDGRGGGSITIQDQKKLVRTYACFFR